MSDQTTLPTEDDLKKLPLRAIAAYAVRCARRAQPLFVRAEEMPDFAKHEATVERVISWAERFCLGDDVLPAAAAANADHASAAADATDWPAATAAAGAAVSAITAAADAAWAAADDDARADLRATADSHAAALAAADNAVAAWAAEAAWAADDDDEDADVVAVECARHAARADYDRLLNLALGAYPSLGQPIDPTENGPLGLLWPEGPPEWWRKRTA